MNMSQDTNPFEILEVTLTMPLWRFKSSFQFLEKHLSTYRSHTVEHRKTQYGLEGFCHVILKLFKFKEALF